MPRDCRKAHGMDYHTRWRIRLRLSSKSYSIIKIPYDFVVEIYVLYVMEERFQRLNLHFRIKRV